MSPPPGPSRVSVQAIQQPPLPSARMSHWTWLPVAVQTGRFTVGSLPQLARAADAQGQRPISNARAATRMDMAARLPPVRGATPGTISNARQTNRAASRLRQQSQRRALQVLLELVPGPVALLLAREAAPCEEARATGNLAPSEPSAP